MSSPPPWPQSPEPQSPEPPAVPQPVLEHQALAAFGSQVHALTPQGFVTEALIALNVAVFLAMVVSGVSPMEPTIASLLDWGANYAPRTTGGEAYRLFTSTFIHIGAIHLLMNMYVLWGTGRLVERILGNAGFLVLYVASGLLGSVASAAWSPYVVSAGASGAVFGVYGGLFGFLARQKHSIPKEALSPLLRSAVVFIGYNLAFGVTQKGIDMAAHLGGLAAGFVAGLVLAHELTPEGAAGRTARNFGLAVGAAAAVAAALFVLPPRVDLQSELDHFVVVEEAALKAFNGALDEAREGRLDDAQVAAIIETKVLPDWHASRQKLAAMTDLPKAQAEVVRKLVAYASAREEAFRLLAEGGRSGDPETMSRANAKQAEAEVLAKALGDVEKDKD
jgi:rhomboid protease GluP